MGDWDSLMSQYQAARERVAAIQQAIVTLYDDDYITKDAHDAALRKLVEVDIPRVAALERQLKQAAITERARACAGQLAQQGGG